MHYKKYAQIPHEEKWDGLSLDYKYIEGFSPLFYETDGTHWDLDHDADSFLESVVSRYWANDLVSPETTYIKILMQGLDFVEKQSHDLVENSDYYQAQTDDDFIKEIIGGPRTKHPDEREFSRLFDLKADISDRISKFIPTLLREIIKVGYTYDGPIDKQGEYEDTPYNHAIIREPGKYLYHYFNDQMVFDNYVQLITVPKLDEEVVAMLDSGVLLEPIVRERYWTWGLDDVIDVVSKNYRGWWT